MCSNFKIIFYTVFLSNLDVTSTNNATGCLCPSSDFIYLTISYFSTKDYYDNTASVNFAIIEVKPFIDLLVFYDLLYKILYFLYFKCCLLFS